MTDLMTAVVTGSTPAVMQDLLDAGEEVNARFSNGRTALLLAGMHSTDTNVLRVLIKAGADVHAQTDEGMSVLHAAAMVNNAAAAAYVIDAGADMEARTNNGTKPLLKNPTVKRRSSRKPLYKVLSGDRVPGFDTILKVLSALGLRFHPETSVDTTSDRGKAVAEQIGQ